MNYILRYRQNFNPIHGISGQFFVFLKSNCVASMFDMRDLVHDVEARTWPYKLQTASGNLF